MRRARHRHAVAPYVGEPTLADSDAGDDIRGGEHSRTINPVEHGLTDRSYPSYPRQGVRRGPRRLAVRRAATLRDVPRRTGGPDDGGADDERSEQDRAGAGHCSRPPSASTCSTLARTSDRQRRRRYPSLCVVRGDHAAGDDGGTDNGERGADDAAAVDPETPMTPISLAGMRPSESRR